MRGKKMDGFPTREQALKDFFEVWAPNDGIEYVPLAEAEGRVTAKTLRSINTLPVYRVSSCDGIAVKSADFENAFPDYGKWILNKDFCRADTGDDFPDEYDAVIMIEEVDLTDDGTITFISPDITVKAGTNVTPRGSSIQEGDLLIEENMPIRPQDMAALAMGGISMIPVWRKPKVAFIPTGSELIPYGVTPARGQNIDTNSLFVYRELLNMGAEPLIFPLSADDPKLLEQRIDEALTSADLIILNAGSAKGSEDFNFGILGNRGRLVHHYIAAAPGRPMAMGVVNGKPVINLSGPSIAAFYGMKWCVRAAVNRWLHKPAHKLPTVKGRLMDDFESGASMALLCMMHVVKTNGNYEIYPIKMSKNRSPRLLTANACYISDVGEEGRSKGEIIEVELTRDDEFIGES